MAARDEHELSLFDLACAKISDAQKLMSEARELLKQDLDNVRQEKSAFEELTKTLDQVHFGSTVKLNVGGKIYKTTLDTLLKDPNSMLCAMFSGRHELKPDEEDGAYFIDRDAELFRYILNYLRDGELLCPDDKTVKKQLLKEAMFYQVQGIIAQLEGKNLSDSLPSSIIIKKERHMTAVMSWLPTSATCSLLFRATADGKTPTDFHRCCDNKGPTLVVIQSGEYICGGYTSKSWTSPGENEHSLLTSPSAAICTHIADSQSFLFTLVNPSGNEEVKIAPRAGASAGILCKDDWGPCFGDKSYYDLLVWAGITSTVGLLQLGYGFTCPENANCENYFTGNLPFEITELEVFQVDF